MGKTAGYREGKVICITLIENVNTADFITQEEIINAMKQISSDSPDFAKDLIDKILENKVLAESDSKKLRWEKMLAEHKENEKMADTPQKKAEFEKKLHYLTKQLVSAQESYNEISSDPDKLKRIAAFRLSQWPDNMTMIAIQVEDSAESNAGKRELDPIEKMYINGYKVLAEYLSQGDPENSVLYATKCTSLKKLAAQLETDQKAPLITVEKAKGFTLDKSHAPTMGKNPYFFHESERFILSGVCSEECANESLQFVASLEEKESKELNTATFQPFIEDIEKRIAIKSADGNEPKKMALASFLIDKNSKLAYVVSAGGLEVFKYASEEINPLTPLSRKTEDNKVTVTLVEPGDSLLVTCEAISNIKPKEIINGLKSAEKVEEHEDDFTAELKDETAKNTTMVAFKLKAV